MAEERRKKSFPNEREARQKEAIPGVASARSETAAGIAAPPREGDVWLAAALSIADGLDWPDSGDLRRSLRRFAAAPALPGFRGLSLPESRTALARALDTALL